MESILKVSLKLIYTDSACFHFADTIAEDELHEGEDDNDLAALQEEAEMDIEELRRKYYSIPAETGEAGLSDAANATGEADEGETSQSELYAFMHTENGEGEGYDSDEDVDFLIDFYKPPRVGPEYQVSPELFISRVTEFAFRR